VSAPSRRASAINNLPAILNPGVPYSRTVMDTSVFGRHPDGTLYGLSNTTLNWVTSTDAVTWADSGLTSTTISGKQEILFDGAGFMYLTTTAGTAWRAPLGQFDAWTNISVPGLPAGTTGRVGLLVPHAGFLFYGNYNFDAAPSPKSGAHIWRSSDNGTTWAEVMTSAGGRHIHNINPDPLVPTRVWAAVGDSGWPGNGVWVSEDTGATWRQVVSNRYPIDVAFQYGVEGVPDRLVMEGDGPVQPHITDLAIAQLPGTGQSHPITAAPASFEGTSRGIRITSEGNLFYISTAEGGATGTKDAIWLAKGPFFERPVLLEDLTGNVPAFYGRTYEVGPYLVNWRNRMARPRFN